MEKYRLHVYFRHYVHNLDTLASYKRIVNRVNRATQLTEFNFNIIVNFDPRMPQDIKDEINRISQKLIESNIEFSIRVGHGASVALFDAMEEVLSNLSVDKGDFLICVVDGDAYAIDDQYFLRQMRKLADSVYVEKAILGLAQRSQIILGRGEMEIYREINELYWALAMRPHLPVKKSVMLKIPGGYAEFGDPVPGFYCVNVSHPKFNQFFEQIEADTKISDMAHFTGDHYMTLLATQFGKIVTEIVPMEDNPPGTFNFENIAQMSHEIGKTSLRKTFLAAVKSEENMKLLEKYYSPEAVGKVRDTILKAMLRR